MNISTYTPVELKREAIRAAKNTAPNGKASAIEWAIQIVNGGGEDRARLFVSFVDHGGNPKTTTVAI